MKKISTFFLTLLISCQSLGILLLPLAAEAGSQTFTGDGTFTVPSYATLTVKVWGGGGAGGEACFTKGGDGGQSSFNGTVIANGGVGGNATCSSTPGTGGSGGTASGGDTNTTGNSGQNGNGVGGTGGNGGTAPGGGGSGGLGWPVNDAHTENPGSPQGGGGGGEGSFTDFGGIGGSGGGGSGGYSTKTYSAGDLTVSSGITVTVGAGGTIQAANAGAGARGEVQVTWTDPVAPTVTTSAASSVTSNSATANGNITATGGQNATVRGFAWGTNSKLSGGDTATTTENGSFGTSAFTASLSSLTVATTYYVRAYATNPAGTGYGSITSFTPSYGRIIRLKKARLRGVRLILAPLEIHVSQMTAALILSGSQNTIVAAHV